MCFGSSPNIPTPSTPQEAKQPDVQAMAKSRKKNSVMGGGSLLTGPSGIESSLNTGSSTLLGP